jgi:hypothetical protein
VAFLPAIGACGSFALRRFARADRSSHPDINAFKTTALKLGKRSVFKPLGYGGRTVNPG